MPCLYIRRFGLHCVTTEQQKTASIEHAQYAIESQYQNLIIRFKCQRVFPIKMCHALVEISSYTCQLTEQNQFRCVFICFINFLNKIFLHATKSSSWSIAKTVWLEIRWMANVEFPSDVAQYWSKPFSRCFYFQDELCTV